MKTFEKNPIKKNYENNWFHISRKKNYFKTRPTKYAETVTRKEKTS